MIDFKTVPFSPALAQAAPRLAPSPRLAQAPATQEPEPPPAPETVSTEFAGPAGLVETVAVLGVLSAAAWVGVRTGLQGKGNLVKGAGWVAGIGSALLGVAYLGAKSGVGPDIGLPGMNVYPS